MIPKIAMLRLACSAVTVSTYHALYREEFAAVELHTAGFCFVGVAAVTIVLFDLGAKIVARLRKAR